MNFLQIKKFFCFEKLISKKITYTFVFFYSSVIVCIVSMNLNDCFLQRSIRNRNSFCFINSFVWSIIWVGQQNLVKRLLFWEAEFLENQTVKPQEDLSCSYLQSTVDNLNNYKFSSDWILENILSSNFFFPLMRYSWQCFSVVSYINQ